MSGFKKFLIAFSVGGFLGTLLFGYAGAKMLPWYWENPANIGVSCKPAVEWTIGRFQIFQLIGMIGGGIVAAVATALLTKKKNDPIEPTSLMNTPPS